ncbi:MAG: rhodanese-like domain-containing protein [Alphaproteobacteria bacterium]|nr:rhodanese-like domain-containing protein [Alphaproteobacteria bacterium]
MMYAGDISPKQAWEFLQSHRDAVLIDVRTETEWHQDGVPDLSTLARNVSFITWDATALNQPSPFMNHVEKVAQNKLRLVLFLCRSGGRSRSAATLATHHGYQQAYNIEGGFLGLANTEGNHFPGWKKLGLPWRKK